MSMESEIDARLIWLRAPGVGPALLASLRANAPSFADALAAEPGLWRQWGVPVSAFASLRQPDRARIEADRDWLSQPDHHCMWPQDPGYPALLEEALPSPPPLFVRGDPSHLLKPGIAVVGSRQASAGGRDNARSFALALARSGLLIVSGLAHGIDAEAHQAALHAHAPTIAVLGTGADLVYPRAHQALAEQIAAHGALISEFPLATPARSEHFPRRNRLIAGITLGTLVIEAGLKSGSLITARLAAEMNREVFALPGSIHNPQARGCHQLIRDGAALIETVQEVIASLASPFVESSPLASESAACASNEHPLLAALGYDPSSFDDLQQRSGLTAQEISTMLTTLLLEGRVADLGGARYQRLQAPPA